MRFFILTSFLIFTIMLIGCSNSAQPTNAVNINSASANVTKASANNPLATTRAPEDVTANNAPTLAPVVQNYYEALKKKDEAGVKRILAQSAISYWEDEAKSEKKSWLAYLTENEEPLDEKREIRNEKIEGDTAIAEMKGGSLGVWTKTKFVRENSEWKFASPKESLALEEIRLSNSNTGK